MCAPGTAQPSPKINNVSLAHTTTRKHVGRSPSQCRYIAGWSRAKKRRTTRSNSKLMIRKAQASSTPKPSAASPTSSFRARASETPTPPCSLTIERKVPDDHGCARFLPQDFVRLCFAVLGSVRQARLGKIQPCQRATTRAGLS